MASLPVSNSGSSVPNTNTGTNSTKPPVIGQTASGQAVYAIPQLKLTPDQLKQDAAPRPIRRVCDGQGRCPGEIGGGWNETVNSVFGLFGSHSASHTSKAVKAA